MSLLIEEDTVWDDDNYVLDKSVGVMPNVQLTIQGTSSASPSRVVFAPDSTIYLQDGATLILQDTEFTSENKIGLGINVLSNGATIHATRFTCTNMNNCIYMGADSTRSLDINVTESSFVDNTIAFGGQAYAVLNVRDTLFLRNQVAVADRGFRFEHCTFAYNARAGNGIAISSYFVGNQRAMQMPDVFHDNLHPSGPFLQDVLFYRNEKALFYDFFPTRGQPIVNVTFLENRVAVEIDRTNYIRMERVNLVDSEQYHVVLDGVTSPWNLSNLYWGTTTTSEIRSFIYDVYMDPMLGPVQIEPVATEPFLHNLWSSDGWIEPLYVNGFYLSNETSAESFTTELPSSIATRSPINPSSNPVDASLPESLPPPSPFPVVQTALPDLEIPTVPPTSMPFHDDGHDDGHDDIQSSTMPFSSDVVTSPDDLQRCLDALQLAATTSEDDSSSNNNADLYLAIGLYLSLFCNLVMAAVVVIVVRRKPQN